jgi:hypothetical protein
MSILNEDIYTKIITFCFYVFFVGLFNLFIGGLCINYIIEFWAPYIVHHSVNIPFLPCAITGIFFAEPAILFSLLTWIISFCI